MKIEYECTFADYQEANRAHATQRSAAAWSALAISFAGLVACVVWALFSPVAPTSATATTAPTAPNGGVNLLVLLLPWALLILVILTIARAGRSGLGRRFDDLTKQKMRWFSPVGTLLAAMVLALLAMMINSVRTTDVSGATSEIQANVARFLPQVPWVFFAIFAIFIFRRVSRVRWKQQPGLARRRVLEFDGETVTTSNRLVTSIYRWEAFFRCVETAHQFMLYPSGITFMMIPKHAFSSPAAINEFRQLIVEWSNGRSVGFSVVQPPPLPLPVESINDPFSSR